MMNRSNRLPRLLPLAAAACLASAPAWATNGMNMEGYGPISTGMGPALVGKSTVRAVPPSMPPASYSVTSRAPPRSHAAPSPAIPPPMMATVFRLSSMMRPPRCDARRAVHDLRDLRARGRAIAAHTRADATPDAPPMPFSSRGRLALADLADGL